MCLIKPLVFKRHIYNCCFILQRFSTNLNYIKVFWTVSKFKHLANCHSSTVLQTFLLNFYLSEFDHSSYKKENLKTWYLYFLTPFLLTSASGNYQYSFYVYELGFVSLSMMPSRSIHSVANGKISLSLWLNNILQYLTSSLSIYSLMNT